MPVTQFIETSESRSATLHRKGKRADSTVTVTYLAFGTSEDTEVHTYVNTYFSSNRYYGIGDYNFMVEQYSLEYVGDECFRVTATYTKAGADDDERPDPLRRSRTFDTSGGTIHRTQAEEERGYSATGPAPNQFKAIGVDGDSVAGVDVIVPALQWTETYDVPSVYVTSNYVKTVAALTGAVNQSTFRSFAAGEVLFAGCSGNQEWDEEKGDGPWSLSFKFIASPNRGAPTGSTGTPAYPAIDVGPITGVFKKGHEYLWVRYEDDVNDNTMLKKPRHVYVNRVYPEADFRGLGIGTG